MILVFLSPKAWTSLQKGLIFFPSLLVFAFKFQSRFYKLGSCHSYPYCQSNNLPWAHLNEGIEDYWGPAVYGSGTALSWIQEQNTCIFTRLDQHVWNYKKIVLNVCLKGKWTWWHTRSPCPVSFTGGWWWPFSVYTSQSVESRIKYVIFSAAVWVWHPLSRSCH